MSDGKTRILLAEDDPQIRLMVERFLSTKSTWKVVSVGNGRDAVEAWRRDEFDMILMDLKMPVMDGFQATQEIRAEESRLRVQSRIPIIGFTAIANRGNLERCFAIGIDDLIIKPMKLDNLLKRLESFEPMPSAK